MCIARPFFVVEGEKNMKKIVITRHKALVDFLLEKGIIENGSYELHAHATKDMIEGKDVIGVLPLGLAKYANTVTSVNLILPPDMRGKELTLEDVRQYCSDIETFQVKSLGVL